MTSPLSWSADYTFTRFQLWNEGGDMLPKGTLDIVVSITSSLSLPSCSFITTAPASRYGVNSKRLYTSSFVWLDRLT
jgi:hypothetical protein